MVVPVHGEVIDEQLDPVFLGVGFHDRNVHVLDEHFNPTTFPSFPHVAWNVKQNSLYT